MKSYLNCIGYAALFLGLFANVKSQAQLPTPESSAVKGDSAVVMPSFNVSTDLSASEKRRMSVSTSRIAVDLMDVPQSISVVDEGMLKEAFALRAVDAIKFVAGVTDSTLPGNVDRTDVRGFQGERSIRDGFEEAFMPGNLPLFNTDRIEVVKGPNPIISPVGPPGGTINRVSKRPSFSSSGTASISVGEHLNELGLLVDSTGPIPGSPNLAYRAVAGYNGGHTEYGLKTPVQQFGFYPGVTYRINSSSLTLLGNIEKVRGSSLLEYGKFPLNPALTGTIHGVPLYDGFNRNVTLDNPIRDAGGELANGHKYGLTAEFATVLGEHVSSQLRARVVDTSYASDGVEGAGNPGLDATNATGGYNPLTGIWTPGFNYSSTAPFTATAVPLTYSWVASRRAATSIPNFDRTQLNIRDDWAVRFGEVKGSFLSTTLLGFGADLTRGFYRTVPISVEGTFDYLHPYANPVGPLVKGSPNDYRRLRRSEATGYASEILQFLKGRLILSGALTYYGVDNARTDANTINPSPASWNNTQSVSHPTSYGVVVKPWKVLSLFYGKNQNAIAPDLRTIGFTNPTDALSQAFQTEYGVKTTLFGDRLFATLTHFDLRATNFSVPNPEKLGASLLDPAVPTFIFADRMSKGWEFELSGKPLRNVSVNLAYAHTEVKNFFGQPIRNVSPDTANAIVRYNTPVRGLDLWTSVNYIGRRPGDTPPEGYTAASTPGHLIIYQPRFYFAARTLANAGVSYTWKRWQLEGYVSNLADLDYIATALNRNALFLGSRREFSSRLSYRF